VHGELERISQSLTQRIKELAERYETPMPQLSRHVEELEAKVNRHLQRMGYPVEESVLTEAGT
jgi:type I restriction enzyme M protein